MASAKEQLVDLIEAYAVAKVSGNAALMAMAASALQQVIGNLLIVDSTLETAEADDFITPETPRAGAARRSRKDAE